MRVFRSALFLSTCIAAPAFAQDADAVARKLSNPIADLASVPFQFNFERGLGPLDDGTRTRLNIQPVVPFSIGEDWNLISRTIVPIIEQHDLVPGTSQRGIGNVTQSLFFSPKATTASGWTWGVGPAFLLPIASNDLLGSDRTGAGPTAVALRQTPSGWTYGGLANHLVSVGGGDGKAFSATFVQPFLSRRIGPGRTLSANAEATYDWKASRWTVPLNLGVSQVIPAKRQMFSVQGGVMWVAQGPAGAPDWGLRLTVTLLYPKS
ncbi:transporter [Noviluteimonas gilva]|uniref:Transporter n=1 Tax=Noviluteimonas gilva TaxID=2682097 RepID=A0A7C9HK79_9GAMM|nr:transporter [Lysobacter gilvus]MUV12675.1 transporter [Lysobacter gilvus]